jgi:hypothetical protein
MFFPPDIRNESAPSVRSRMRLSFGIPCICLSIFLVLFTSRTVGQEAIRSSIAGEAAAQAHRIQAESLPYTIKSGDFRLLLTPSLDLDFNDNIRASKVNREDDFILRPTLALAANYPLTDRNLLQLNVTFGYDNYFKHSNLSTWRVGSGSDLSFDIFIKDVAINLHDRFSYAQDSAQEAAVANTARYGVVNNTVGLSATWDLQDLTLTAGYDHANVISPASEFKSQDHNSELFDLHVGLRVDPHLSPGVEATASVTTYDQMVLNDNTSYSFGLYADWQPGLAFHVKPRVGYTIFQFDGTSQSVKTSDLNSWYADLGITHDVTDTISYTLSAGHEVRLGIQSDAIDDWYFRPSIQWKIIKALSLQTFFSYEHGKQGAGNVFGNLLETYDFLGCGFGLSYPLLKKLTVGLNYRLTLRSSSTPGRGYSQNLVSLQLSYHPQ